MIDAREFLQLKRGCPFCIRWWQRIAAAGFGVIVGGTAAQNVNVALGGALVLGVAVGVLVWHEGGR